MYLALFRVFLFVCIIFTAFPMGAAVAASIDAKGAKRLQKMFEDVIAEQQQYNPAEGPRLAFEGDVIVEPTEKYYAITLPYYRIYLEEGMRLDFGMVSINATPDESTPGRWKMAVATPTPITIVGPDEKPLFRINIGAQRAAGIWDEDVKNFVKLDALYSDITAQSTENESFRMILPQVLVRYDFTEGDQGKLSGDGFIAFKNMAMNVAEAGFKGSIGNIRVDFKMVDFDPQFYLEQQQRLQALARSSTEDLDVQAHGEEMIATVLNLYKSLGEQAQFTYHLKDIEFAQTKDDGTLETVRVDDFSFGADIGGFLSNNVYFGLAFGFLGLEPKVAQADAAIAPRDVNFDVKMKNLPINQIVGIGQNAMQASVQNPNGGGMAMMSMAMKLPVVLAQAGTRLEIKNSFIGNDSYRFEIEGHVKADMEAVNSATADIKGSFKGLEALLQQLRVLAINNPDLSSHYDQISKQLTGLQAFGAKQGENDLYLYNFQMNAQGQMLLNGQDAAAVMGGRR